jgi:hypothetical protein
MAPYAEQVIICTGKEDWASNIEQEEGATGEFVSGLKSVIGKGGEGFDVRTPSRTASHYNPSHPKDPKLTPPPSHSTISL